jgi:hypothetical protein
MFSCNNTEEAFLISSLNEIVKVWARGSGQAKFDLNICDGVAELSLNFKLGHPSDQHCDPPHPTQQHVQPDAQHEGEEHGPDQETFHPVPQRKSQARRERNRLRAARHRAAVATEAAAAATEAVAASTNIILPFKGTILPVLRREEVNAAPRTAASTSPRTATPTSPTTASTVEAAVSAAKLVRPVKACQTHSTSFDAELIKKRLFPIPSSHQVPPRNPDTGIQKCYKMKEDDLWTKLFSL